MNTFTEKESYKHKMAKEVLKQWFSGGKCIGNIGCMSPNRECGVFLEYPIVKTKDYNSLEYNWDEILVNPKIPKEIDPYSNEYHNLQNEYVPTHEECISLGIYPKRIIDLVLTNKGVPEWFIEICHKNPVSEKKINELKILGMHNLIEIDAEWILTQVEIPKKLKYKRLL